MPTIPGMQLPELPNIDMSGLGFAGQMPELQGMAPPIMPKLEDYFPEMPNIDMNFRKSGLHMSAIDTSQLNANMTEGLNFDMSQLNTDLAGLGDFDLSQLNTSLPVGPVPTAGAGGGQISLTMQIDRIEITTSGGDPEEIAAQVGDELRIQARQLVEEIDSMVRA